MPDEHHQAIREFQPLLYRTCCAVTNCVDNTFPFSPTAEKYLSDIQSQWNILKISAPPAMKQTVSKLIDGASSALREVDPNAFVFIIARLSQIFSGPSSAVPDGKSVFKWERLPHRAGHKQLEPGFYLPIPELKFQENMAICVQDLSPAKADELMSHVAGFVDPVRAEEYPAHHKAMVLWWLEESIFRDKHHLPNDAINIIRDFAGPDPIADVKSNLPDPRYVAPANTTTRTIKDKIIAQIEFMEQPRGRNAFNDNLSRSAKIVAFTKGIRNYIKNGAHTKDNKKSLSKKFKAVEGSLKDGDADGYIRSLNALLSVLPPNAKLFSEDGNPIEKTNEQNRSKKGKLLSRIMNLSPRDKNNKKDGTI